MIFVRKYNGSVGTERITEGGIIVTYAFELFFDSEMEEKIMTLARIVAEKGISTRYLEWKTHPHITLGVFEDIDETKGADILKAFAKSHAPSPAFLHSVAMFTDTKVVYLLPALNQSLFDLQRELYDRMSEFHGQWKDWYRPDVWAPHCAVALTAEDGQDAFYQASELILRAFQKTGGMYSSVGLVKITFPVEELARFAFEGGRA